MDIDFSSILSDEDLKSGIQSKLFGFSVLCEDSELYRVTWGDQIGVAHVENLHNKRYIKMHYLFGDGYKYDVPFQNVIQLLESRTIPRTRDDLWYYLKAYGLREYNPLEMVKKDHGVSYSDFYWIRFMGEELTFNDVRVR